MDITRFAPLYTAQQTRELDRCAIQDHGIPGITLMSRAAAAAYDYLLECWPEVERVQVLAGTGNNGGDGYLLADLAHKRGLPASVLQVGDARKISGDALQALQQAQANGVEVRPFAEEELLPCGVIVDALLGTGLGGDVRGEYREAIEAINAAGVPVLAVDIPSGICADTGRVLGCAVRADATATFIGRKRGLYTLDAMDHTGPVRYCSLGVPAEVFRRIDADAGLLDLDLLLAALAPRPATAHKGKYGTVLVIGGDHGMAGAAALAGEAALRCGAGLVRVATRPEHVAPLVARTPELMPLGVESGADLQPLVESADVLVAGPGLGQSSWSEYLLRVAVNSGKPLVLDADGLNQLAAGRVKPRPGIVYTPHPGEAGRLLRSSTAEVQADRFAAARELQRQLGGVVVLKGNGSLVAGSGELWLSPYGNPGMASGGMGDVLSGVIGALLAQGLAAPTATALGVCLHGAAGDLAAIEGQRGLIASDLMPHLRELLG